MIDILLAFLNIHCTDVKDTFSLIIISLLRNLKQKIIVILSFFYLIKEN